MRRFFQPFLVMMMFLVAGVISLAAQERAAIQDRPMIVTSSREFRHEIRMSDFANVPVWNVEASEVPISPIDAIRASRAGLGRYVSSPELWEVRMINLMRVGTSQHWFYRITFMCAVPECRKFTERSFSSVIKMDGTEIAPKRIVAVD